MQRGSPRSSRPRTKLEIALNNSFGFGGYHATLAFHALTPRGLGAPIFPIGMFLGALDCSAVEPRCILANREIGVPRALAALDPYSSGRTQRACRAKAATGSRVNRDPHELPDSFRFE
jgi:hypothetical protein